MGHKEKGNKAERGNSKEVSAQSCDISPLTRKQRGTAQCERRPNCIILLSWGFAERHFRLTMRQGKDVHLKILQETD